MTGAELRKFRNSMGMSPHDLGVALGYRGTHDKVRGDVRKLERRQELDDHIVEKVEVLRFRRLKQMRSSHDHR